MTANAFDSFRQAYLLMAPFYRPTAPGDGMGVVLPRDSVGRKDVEQVAWCRSPREISRANATGIAQPLNEVYSGATA